MILGRKDRMYKNVHFEVHATDSYLPDEAFKVWSFGIGGISAVSSPSEKKTIRLMHSLIDVSPWMRREQITFIAAGLQRGLKSAVVLRKQLDNRGLELLDQAMHEGWAYDEAPPRDIFSKAEARITAAELRSNSLYFQDAPKWRRFHQKQASRFNRLQRDWIEEHGEADANYAVAEKRAHWLAEAWMRAWRQLSDSLRKKNGRRRKGRRR